MSSRVVLGDLQLPGSATAEVKVVTGTVFFQSSLASLDAVRVHGVLFADNSSANNATIGNLAHGTASVDGIGNMLVIGNAANANIEIGGMSNVVEVEAGNVTYNLAGIANAIEDGSGNSEFFIHDAIIFNISDGAGDDTIVVEASEGVITLGDGEDVIWFKSGFVDIIDFNPGEDTLLIGEAGTEFSVTSSLALDFIDGDGNVSGITVLVAEELLV